jgi:hypothetical protein
VAEKGKRKACEVTSDDQIGDMQNISDLGLQNQVVNAPTAAQTGSDDIFLSQQKDPAFKNFINELASSSSDKSFHLKKQFSQFLPPIVENVAENEDIDEEQVDYESGDSSQATDMPFIESGRGVLALAVPTPRQETSAVIINVGGSQPEVEYTQEELASQVDNPLGDEDGGQQDILPEGPTRRSTRVDTQGDTSIRIDDKAQAAAERKDLSGTSLNTSNSFAILDDDDIIARALEMGVSKCSLHLEKVHYLKDLEIARHSIKEMQEKEEAVTDSEPSKILLLGFSDNMEDDMVDYIPVVSRRTKKQRKSAEKRRRRGTPAKSSVASGGALAKSSAASVKVHNDHPLCGIVTGTRNRRKNSKYL